MKTFNIRVMVSLDELVTVKANTEKEALEIVKNMASNGEVEIINKTSCDDAYGGYDLDIENIFE